MLYLFVQHLLVIKLAILLVLGYIRLNFTPNGCNLHIGKLVIVNVLGDVVRG